MNSAEGATQSAKSANGKTGALTSATITTFNVAKTIAHEILDDTRGASHSFETPIIKWVDEKIDSAIDFVTNNSN